MRANPKMMNQNPKIEKADTRSRILQAALRLFRKHGYHGVGINDILALAEAPKGSMYHHFPGGKEEIGVAVIGEITNGLLALFAASRARKAESLIAQVGEQLAVVMQKTNNEICALFSAFVSEQKTSPLLGQAVADSYQKMIAILSERLHTDGWPKRQCADKALTVIALLEGGALLSHAQRDQIAFRLAVKQAVVMCSLKSID